MRMLIFTEGTIIMHRNAVGRTRDEIVKQVEQKEKSVHDYKSYVPVGNAVKKLQNWKKNGAEILYLTSRRKPEEIKQIQNIINKYEFPDGQFLFRRKDEMTITYVKQGIKKKIKSIVVKEFGGIDHLPDKISALIRNSQP